MARNPFLQKISRRLPKLAPKDLVATEDLTLADYLAWYNEEKTPLSLSSQPSRRLKELSPTRSRSRRLCPRPSWPQPPLSLKFLEKGGDCVGQLLSAYREWGLPSPEPSLVLDRPGQLELVAGLREKIARESEVCFKLRDRLFLDSAPEQEKEPAANSSDYPVGQVVAMVESFWDDLGLPSPPLQIDDEFGRFLGYLVQYASRCEERALECADLLDQNLTDDSFSGLIDLLTSWYDRYHPLLYDLEHFCDLESYMEHTPCVYLPHFSYEGSDAFEETAIAFLEGADSVAARLALKDDEENIELNEADRFLVQAIGWKELVRHFAESQDPHCLHWNLRSLENHWDAFFTEVFNAYPSQYERLHVWMVSSGESNDFSIHSVEDVAFCVAYHEAFEALRMAIPVLDDSDEGGAGEDLHAFVEAVLCASRLPRTLCDQNQETTHAA